MKVEAKTRVWVRGRIHQPGESIELPYDVATEGVKLGLFVAPVRFEEPEQDVRQEAGETEDSKETEEEEEAE